MGQLMADGGSHPFTPDWCLAPAACLREWMEENGLSPGILAVAARGRAYKAVALTLIEEVLARAPLTERHAEVLEDGTRIPARFWLNYEHNYRAGLAAGLKDVTGD
jgi:hypothetical protein